MRYETDELYHYGVKGMKWGVRRDYKQLNYPKSSRKLSNDDIKEKVKKTGDKIFTQNIKGGKDKPNLSPAEKIAKTSSSLIRDTQGVVNNIYKSKKKTDLSDLSDNELRSRINRLELENRYRSISGIDITKGERYANDILNNVGSLVEIGGGIASIAATIYMIRKGKK